MSEIGAYSRPILAIFYRNTNKREVVYVRHYRWLSNAIRMGMIELYQQGEPGSVIEYVYAETGTQLGWSKISATGKIEQTILIESITIERE